MSTGLERRIAREQPDALNLLGMDRMIRRAYEVATSNRPGVTRAWHEAELRAAEKRRVAMPYNAGGNATERSEGRVDHNVGRQLERSDV